MAMLMRERTEVRAFLRRLRTLAVAIALLVVLGTLGLSLTEHVDAWEGFQWALDTVATIGAHPSPETVRRADHQGPADRAGRRYALLRPGDR